MILNEFSKYIQLRKEEIAKGKTGAAKILCDWIRLVIHKNPKGHVEKIVHHEIMLAENNQGNYLIVAKSPSGQTLINALYNYTQSYEHYILNKWLQDKKATDFRDKY